MVSFSSSLFSVFQAFLNQFQLKLLVELIVLDFANLEQVRVVLQLMVDRIWARLLGLHISHLNRVGRFCREMGTKEMLL